MGDTSTITIRVRVQLQNNTTEQFWNNASQLNITSIFLELNYIFLNDHQTALIPMFLPTEGLLNMPAVLSEN